MQITVTNDIFGQNLLYLRKKYSISRLGLARLLGTAAVLIEQWETCRVYPTLDLERLDRICTIFQIDSHTFLHTDLTGDRSSSL